MDEEDYIMGVDAVVKQHALAAHTMQDTLLRALRKRAVNTSMPMMNNRGIKSLPVGPLDGA